MSNSLRLLLTTAALITPQVFGDSAGIFAEDSDSRFRSCVSFVDTEETGKTFLSGSSSDGTDKNASWINLGRADLVAIPEITPTATDDKAFQTALAQCAGTAAYKALYPQMKSILWMELNKLLNGTGMVALTADGQKLSVVRGTFDGLLDLILNSLGVNSSIRSGVNLATTISGQKAHIEKELKRLLRVDSLDSLIEKLAQHAVLKSMGLAVDAYNSYSKSLTLDEIANVQQSVSLEDNRADTLSDAAAKADLSFVTGFVFYELKILINKATSDAINAHLDEARLSAIRAGTEKLNAATMVVAGGLIGSGLTGVLQASALLAINHKYGNVVATAAYDAFNHVAVNGLVNVRNTAVLPISEDEIRQFHSVATEVNTTDVGNFVNVDSVNKTSFGGAFISGAASNAVVAVTSYAVDALKVGVKTFSSIAKKFSFWGTAR